MYYICQIYTVVQVWHLSDLHCKCKIFAKLNVFFDGQDPSAESSACVHLKTLTFMRAMGHDWEAQ